MYKLLYLIATLIDIVEWLVIIRCILSWFPSFQNGFTELVYKLTEPLMAPVRNLLFRFIRPGAMMLDVSPIVLYLLLELVRRLLYIVF